MRFLIQLFFVFQFSSPLFSQFLQQQSDVARPMVTPYGIVFSNENGSALYLSSEKGTEELLNSPGCGMYVTLSPDKATIGFKYISDDGLQTPALFNLATRKISLLQNPTRRAGQVSFSRNGSIAYSIENDVYVQTGSSAKKFSIGTYANIVSLSSDGKYFAFNNDNGQLFVCDIYSNRIIQITNGKRAYFLPLWSPTENTLCYSGMDGTVFVYAMKTNETFSLGAGFNPIWTNDGKEIILERRETQKHQLINSDLYKISFNGKNEVQLTHSSNICEADAFVDENNLLFFRAHNNNNIYQLLTNNEIRIAASVDMHNVVRLEKPTSAIKKTLSPQVYFEMPYTHQVYDTPDWYNGHSACGPTSSIMVIAYYGILPEWKVWCSASSSSPGHYSTYGNYVCEKYNFRQTSYAYTASDPNGKTSWGGYGYMWNGSYSPYSRMTSYYALHGLSATRADSSAEMFSLITNEVTSGYPYTLCNGLTTAGHIVVVNGIGNEAHTFIVNDPYGNKNSGKYPSLNGKGVAYDWPGYNNGNSNFNRIYWGVAVRYNPPAAADSIVDDLQFTKGFSMSNTAPASMSLWSDKITGYNNHFWYVKTKKSDTCYAVWRPTIPQDGMYEVFAFVQYANAKAARYTIQHSVKLDTVVINQSPLKAQWISLGTFPFLKGTSGYVRLGDGSDSVNQEIVFDAIRFDYTAPLSVHNKNNTIPSEISLEQNYPNPFNPVTTIQYIVGTDVHPSFNSKHGRASVPTRVTLKIYDILGKEIATLVDKELSAGEYSVEFNASKISSGMYVYQLRAGNSVITKKMAVVK